MINSIRIHITFVSKIPVKIENWVLSDGRY